MARGYTWRYVAHDKITSLKLEKIINKDLHPISISKRGLRTQELIDKAQDPKFEETETTLKEMPKKLKV